MTNAVTIAQQGSNNTTFRNRIINGAMVFDQRNAGASITPTNGQYSLDRWVCWGSQASKYSTQQNAGNVTLPVGFLNYLGVTSLSAYSVSVSDYFFLNQRIEGFNTADFQWGTANAKTVTLSFQVYSSLTGTFGGALINSAQTRSYPFTYTISSANTWTSISVTIAGDTAGTWIGATNGIGIGINFGLGVGSTSSGTAGAWAAAAYYSATGATSVVGTNGATFYVTGVQLEAGSTASPFEQRLYGTELALCQRYYFQYAAATASNDFQEIVVRGALTGFDMTTYLPVTMRSAPTLVLPSGSTYGRLVGYDSAFAATAVNVTAMSATASQSLSAIRLTGTNASMTFAQGQGSTSFDTNNISVGLGLSAEL